MNTTRRLGVMLKSLLPFLLLNTFQGASAQIITSGSGSVDVNGTIGSDPSSQIITSGSGSVDVDGTIGSGEGVKWWMFIGGTGVTFILVLCLACPVLVAVYMCVCRKRRRSHQTGDYAIMDSFDSSAFHSIPYRQDGLPECPIYHSLAREVGSATRKSTWTPPGNRRVPYHATTPNMTWYYNAGKPVPVLSLCGDGDSNGGCLRMSRKRTPHSREKKRGTALMERGRGGGRERDYHVATVKGVPVEQFEELVFSKYEDEMSGFQEEFSNLYTGSDKRVTIAQKLENRAKNRYSNFYPYNAHRVMLQSILNDHSTYINASPINGFSMENKFIATQIPLSHTVEDFWKMVWQEKATCLVLLTVGREEGYSRPGDRYCPDGQETWCIGSFLVTTTFKKEYAHHILRYITIQVSGSVPLEVCQLQITHWSQQSIHRMASTLLVFHRRFSELTRGTTQPTVVHCNTGSDLTGVFIAVDCALEAVEEKGRVDVWDLVNDLRHQRPKMVLNLEQYILIHEVVLESIRWGNTEIPVSELPPSLADCEGEEGEEGGETTGIIEKMFNAVGPVKSAQAESTREDKCPTFYGNHPLWISHTAPSKCIHIGSDTYHRPTAVRGYWQDNVLLVTHSPSRTSSAQFWRNVLDHKCSTIIAISHSNKERYQYWPDEAAPVVTAKHYTVHLLDEGKEGGGEGREKVREEGEGEEEGAREGAEEQRRGGETERRTFKVEHCTSGQTHVVSQFHVVEWAGDILPLCEAVEEVLRVLSTNKHAPVLIHCSDGASVCGVVCAVVIAVEQGHVEGLVDIPRTVRGIRTTLPTAVSTMEQMKLVLATVTTLLTRKKGKCPILKASY